MRDRHKRVKQAVEKSAQGLGCLQRKPHGKIKSQASFRGPLPIGRRVLRLRDATKTADFWRER